MKKYFAEIKIMLKRGILDVQGKTVENALHSMEFQNISNLRIGKLVELSIEAENKDEAYKIVESACSKLIANPIIEDFIIQIHEEPKGDL
ncbi:MAG: phosphoribosylformylglycinamidine synthase subunit PurS [Candidatus Kapaibacteriota bacterium]